jgi:signal transduction histidine kinase
MLTLAVIWTVGLIRISLIEASEQAVIESLIEDGIAIDNDTGHDGLIAAVRWDESRNVWTNEDIFVMLKDEETLMAYRDPENEIMAGFGGLWASDEITPMTLDHPQIEQTVMTQGHWFDDGRSILVGRFVPDRVNDIEQFVSTATLALFVIVLPLALLTGFFLSRGVFQRLETLWQTAETVSKGQLDARAPLTGTGDEFDRLGSGINQMLDKVEGLTRNVEAVSVGVAHDLKTPLANIGGRLELIRRDIENPAAVAEHVDLAEARLQSLLRIFDALLRMGEIESGARRSAFGSVDVSTLCTDMIESFAPLFEEADKTLNVVIAPNLKASGDRDLLTQLTANLLENALEHSRDAANVHVLLSRNNGDIYLEIGDDGPGIAPGSAERVFERFFRADASRSTPGNGLGLALVKAIADLHHADIKLLTDRPGAVFAVTLPAAA